MLHLKFRLHLATLMIWFALASHAQNGVSARAAAIHNSAIVVDTHADTPMRLLDENFDLATDAGKGHFDLKKVKAGNLGAEFFSIWVEPKKNKGQYAHRAMQLIDSVYRQAERHPEQMVMAYSADDIVRARSGSNKRLAALLGVEGGHAIENDLGILRDFYRLGVRYMTLTWANSNEWADSSGDVNDAAVAHHNGLTDFGRQVVREMNRLGMMVDISHVADKTFWDVIAVTKAPVIASHSSARALCNVPRNMTDDMLRAVTKNGGVVMVNFFPAFIDQKFADAEKAMGAARREALKAVDDKTRNADPATQYREHQRVEEEWDAKIPRPGLKVLIDHIDHIAKVAGVDHVGLGSDFDGITATPVGMESIADLPKITAALLARGYNEEQIKKILGGNLLRVFREVERISHDMQKAQK